MHAPADSSPILVFDGDCGFCTRSAKWVERHLPASSAARVEPWQRLDLKAIGLTPAEADSAAWWVTGDGRPRRGHRAIAASLRAVGGVWGVVGRVIDVPPASWLARVVYALIAKYRYRMPGGTPACKVD